VPGRIRPAGLEFDTPGLVYHWLPVAVLQNDIVVQHTALVARVDVQKCFFVSRVALEQDVVTDDALYWTQHDYGPASPCRLDAVTQHLKPKDNANTFKKDSGLAV